MPKRSVVVCCVLCLASAGAWSKLPAPGPEEEAKAAEAKAKKEVADKAAADQLAKAQDRVVEKYLEARKAKEAPVAPLPAQQ
jgi:hypothetical protein